MTEGVGAMVAAAGAAHAERRRGQIAVALAALAWSSAGVIQRSLTADTGSQVALRALFAIPALLLFVGVTERRGIGGTLRALSPRALGPAGLSVAVCTGLASSVFIIALTYTTVANVLFTQAVAPIAAALIAWVALRDPVGRRTAVAMVVALAGVGVMVGGPGGSRGIGIVLAGVMTISFAVGVVITRHRRDISMGPAICLSQVLVALVALPLSHPGRLGGHDLALLALLGIGQMALGLAFITIGARLIPAAEVAVITLLEIVAGPLWVWLARSETPSTATFIGGAVVVVAVAVQATGQRAAAPSAA